MTLAFDYASQTPDVMPQDSQDLIQIETRFGAFTFAAEQAVEMPTGMVGFPEFKQYGLATPAEAGYEGFVILQCLTEAELGFITAPIAKEDGPIAEADLRDALTGYGVAWEDAAVLVVCTIRSGEGGAASLSINLQAPVIVDARRRRAWQHVFHGGKYPVRQELV